MVKQIYSRTKKLSCFPFHVVHARGRGWSQRGILSFLLVIFIVQTFGRVLHAQAVYQYSVKEGDRRVYLWVPPDCFHIRGLVVAFENMTELGWLNSPIVRSAAAQECLGVVWIGQGENSALSAEMSPSAGLAFLKMQRDLARVSGFPEIADAAIFPTGHSAHGQFAWNFAQWAPQRTIAAIAVKTVNLPYDLDLHGVPLLYIVGQSTEWPQYYDGRLSNRDFVWSAVRQSALAVRKQRPDAKLAVVVDPGGGHFDWNEKLSRLFALYLRTACAERLPRNWTGAEDRPPVLRTLVFSEGWLIGSGGMKPDLSRPAPVDQYRGDPSDAYWVFDRSLANMIEHIEGDRRPLKLQMLSFEQQGKVLPVAIQGFAALQCKPRVGKNTFQLKPVFLSKIPLQLVGHGQPLGHAQEKIRLHVIFGPIVQIAPYTFRFALRRDAGEYGWIEEEANQTANYRKAVQPARIALPTYPDGRLQQIIFHAIPPQQQSAAMIALHATSSIGLPVRFYVLSGPVVVVGDHLKIVDFPKGGADKIRVLVVAYQLGEPGNGKERAIQAAKPVLQEFTISRS